MAELSANEKIFHQAARNGDLNLLKKLGKKVNINSISRDIFQCTPLHRAALSGSIESVKFLLDNGAQINAKTLYRNRTPLHFAAIFNTLNVVRCLVEHGAQLDAKDSYNKTAWDKATQLGNFRIAQYLENKMKKNPNPTIFQEEILEEKISNQDLCIICLEPRNGFYALYPCGHLSLCENCCIAIKNDIAPKCPTCRKPVQNYLKLFHQAA